MQCGAPVYSHGMPAGWLASIGGSNLAPVNGRNRSLSDRTGLVRAVHVRFSLIPYEPSQPLVVQATSLVDVRLMVLTNFRFSIFRPNHFSTFKMREIVHVQAGQCGNQIGAKFWEIIR